jgi:hypothetical protein
MEVREEMEVMAVETAEVVLVADWEGEREG